MTSDRTAVRREDAFDEAAVAGWLAQNAEISGVPEVEQYRRGASNLTYLLRYPDRSLVLRRPPIGQKAQGAHDMVREYTVQQRLAGVYPYVPPMVALCEDESIIGTPFYVMEHVDGIILRSDLPDGVTLPPDAAGQLASTVVDRLVDLHRVDPQEAGLEEFGRGSGYVARQVAGWSARYRRAVTPDAPDFQSTIGWLNRELPPDVDTCVIHNDYRLDNVVLDGQLVDIRAVLDWEMATLGDPLMDLACALAYWIEAGDPPELQALRRQPTYLSGMPTRDDVFEYYCIRTGRAVDNWDFYEVFGVFRLAVIMQQIYLRYYLGQTSNPAFASYGETVKYLHRRCEQIRAGSNTA